MAKSKLASIETLISQALIDMKISYEEFNAIVWEKQKYKRMKENLRKANDTAPLKNKKIWRLNSVEKQWVCN